MTERAMRQNYAATVRLLLTDDVATDGEAADAISGLLTECGIYQDAIKDWSYMHEDGRWKHAELVDVPVDYDRDEDTIPGAETASKAALDLVRQLARMDPPDEREEIAEVEGEIEAFSHMIRKAKEIIGGNAAPAEPERDIFDWSGPEEGDTVDLSVWITSCDGDEIALVDSGDVERNKEIAREIVAKLNAMSWPLEDGIIPRLIAEAIAAEGQCTDWPSCACGGGGPDHCKPEGRANV